MALNVFVVMNEASVTKRIRITHSRESEKNVLFLIRTTTDCLPSSLSLSQPRRREM